MTKFSIHRPQQLDSIQAYCITWLGAILPSSAQALASPGLYFHCTTVKLGQHPDKPGQRPDKPGQRADKPWQHTDKPGQSTDKLEQLWESLGQP